MRCEGQNRQESETESLGWWVLEMVRCEEPAGGRAVAFSNHWTPVRVAIAWNKRGLFGQISQACLGISKSEALAWGPGPEILPLHRYGLVSNTPRTSGSGGLLGRVGTAATPRCTRQGTATLTLRV